MWLTGMTAASLLVINALSAHACGGCTRLLDMTGRPRCECLRQLTWATSGHSRAWCMDGCRLLAISPGCAYRHFCLRDTSGEQGEHVKTDSIWTRGAHPQHVPYGMLCIVYQPIHPPVMRMASVARHHLCACRPEQPKSRSGRQEQERQRRQGSVLLQCCSLKEPRQDV